MHSHERLLALVTRLYEAPETTGGWRAFLSDLCDTLGGSAASFISQDFTSQRVQIAETVRTDPDTLRAYNGYWHRHDPWAHSPRAARLSSGSVAIGDALIDRTDMRRTAFYNEFGRAHDLVQDLAGLIEVSGRRLSCVSINGSARRAPFSADDAALLAALMPHMQNALELHRRLALVEAARADVLPAIDRLAEGVLLVTSTGRVVHANRTARALLHARDGVFVDAGDLRAASAADTATLRAAIHAAASTRVRGSAARRLFLTRPSGRRPYVVLVAPAVTRLLALTPVAPAVVVCVSDPERLITLPIDRLRRLFGLTAAEARVASCLFEGDTPAVAAARLDISVPTVRAHLRQILAKTETTSQAELARVLSATLLSGLDR
jgi:DNA-binding CsgD family transcriptional regulator